MDDTQGKEKSAAGAVIEAMAAFITGEDEGDASFQLSSVFEKSLPLSKSKEPAFIKQKIGSISPANEKETDLNSTDDKVNSEPDVTFEGNINKLEPCAETDLETVRKNPAASMCCLPVNGPHKTYLSKFLFQFSLQH